MTQDEKQGETTMQKESTAETLVIGFFQFLYGLLQLAAFLGIGYVIAHFIVKYW
jgi:hypothetical protein